MIIQDVWLHNFFDVMDEIGRLVDEYNYIAMVSEAHNLTRNFNVLPANTALLLLPIGHGIPWHSLCAH